MSWPKGDHPCGGCDLRAPPGRKYCHICEGRVRAALRRGTVQADEERPEPPRTADGARLHRALRMYDVEQ
jgi:hypothetical protein